MSPCSVRRSMRSACAGLGLACLAGCAGLLPQAPPTPALYSLDIAPEPVITATAATAAQGPAGDGPTLVISPPRAAAGFDSARMLYLRQPHQLEAFTHSEWVDAPARMLAGPIVAALQDGSRWRAVVSAPSAAGSDWRLDVELLRLHQDFTVVPSQVRLTLRATLVDTATRRVVAWSEFDERVPAPSENAYGGVVAAQQALRAALASLRLFCDDAVSRWTPPTPRP
jgi:cholesterol transport system auxiliary component